MKAIVIIALIIVVIMILSLAFFCIEYNENEADDE